MNGYDKLVLENVKNPPKETSFVYCWEWSCRITKEEIDKKLDELYSVGVRGCYIRPLPKDFRPETLRTFLEPEYLSEEFFELVRHATERALALGMDVWIYDEGGWPSGGACTNTLKECPEAAPDLIESLEITLAAGEKYSLSDGAIALFDGKKRLPDAFTAERSMTIEEYYTKPYTTHPNIVDLTNPKAIDTFINNTYEKYKSALGKKLGTEITVFFTDEPTVLKNCLPKGGFDVFYQEYGYDLRDYLFVIKGLGELATTPEEIKARIDYGRLLGKLLRDNAFAKLRAWCRENGMRFGGHLNNDNIAWGGMFSGCFGLVDCLRKFDAPGIDVIWEQIRYPYENRSPLDDESRKFGFFPRLASSAARQECNKIAISESFAIYGDALTPEEIKYVINYQVIRGINRFNFMSAPQSNERCASLICRPAFSPEKPGFFNFSHINDYVSRISYLASIGQREGDTALYHPAADFWGNPECVSEATDAFGDAGTALEDDNVQFDIIDDGVIMDAEVTPCGLKIGDAVYKHVVVPSCKYMPSEVYEKVKPFISHGEPVCDLKSKKLRVMTKKVDNSRLWFIFNEGLNTETELIDAAKGKRIYEIDVRSGKVYSREEMCPTLTCGDIAVYYVTDDIIPCDEERKIASSTLIEGFRPAGYEKFTVTALGCDSVRYEGAPSLDSEFSGTVCYKAHYSLPFTPERDTKYRIRLVDTQVSASVYLDGKKAGEFGLLPMVSDIPKGLLKASGEIEIRVSNTAANELCSKHDFIIANFPKAEVGVYTLWGNKQTSFEQRCPTISLGKVYLEEYQ